MSLYIFDKDKTLLRPVRRWLLFSRSPDKPEEQVLKDGVYEKIASLRAAGHQIAIATNQPAVAHGLITLDQAEALVDNCAQKIGGVSTWRLSPYAPHARDRLKGKPNPYAREDITRKPHPGMLLQIMKELDISPEDTFMIGDKKVDKKAAQAAGVEFVDEKKFFKD